MRSHFARLVLVCLLAGGLAACGEDSSILAPDGGEQTEIDLMVDEDLTEAMVADAEAALAAVQGAPASSSQDLGVLFAEPSQDDLDAARDLLQQAREKFRQAREAWLSGDTERAAELAMEGRLLIAEALVLVFGEEAYDRLLERVDNFITWLEEQVDEEASDLLARIRELRDEAEALRDQDLIAATERLVLAMQIAHRELVLHRRAEVIRHARFSIFMANSALELAARFAGDDATDAQIHAFRHAQHIVVDAAAAFAAGRFRLALVLAREAVNLSLLVVMLEPGLEGQRLQAMIDLSQEAIAAAEEALASVDTDPFAQHLLELAKNLQSRALEIAEEHPRRAIKILWHSSVTAYGVVRLVS